MPWSPQKLSELLPYLLPAAYFLLRFVELLVRKREFPRIRGWDFVGLFFLWFGGRVTDFMQWLFPPSWVFSHRLFDGGRLGLVGGAIAGIFATSFVWYLWHRAAHRNKFLWRFVHQMHHSVRRLDLPASVYVHPLDIFFQAVIDTLVTISLLGLRFEAVLAVIFVHAFCEMFQHMNIGTPTWLGWFIQRPEAHCVHHQKGVHAFNYSFIPIWDRLFGTFRNPEVFTGEVGFEPEASRRVLAMLVGIDVNRPPAG